MKILTRTSFYNEGEVTVDIVEKIKQLKEERNAVILAHYYVDDDIQAIADYVGDSYYLSKIAVDVTQKVIVFCGVSFMGESAKILNPNKTVLMPDASADCPMAHMADPKKIQEIKEKYEDVAVVCYINSTAILKTYSDVCVTSANAMKIVKALPNKYIYFIPDENLGRYIASKVPEKTFIFNEGYCHIHKDITKEAVLQTKKEHPGVKVLVHPECTYDVLEVCDYVGSTSGIIEYASKSEDQEFIIATELGVLYDLKQKNPNKTFYGVNTCKQTCLDMKKITLQKVYDALKNMETKVEMDESLRKEANKPLERMLELAKS